MDGSRAAKPDDQIPAPAKACRRSARCSAKASTVNITLLFAQARYEEVVEAYLSGLEILATKQELDFIASVASFFVSRMIQQGGWRAGQEICIGRGGISQPHRIAEGKTAIANAKLAYQYYKRAFAGDRWEKLKKLGARPQRLLWASTSTKNKAYSDVLYVDSLIGSDTVNTIPLETLDAFRDHGHPAATLDADVDNARRTLADLEKVGVSLDRITDELVTEGVDLFAQAADQLYGALAAKRAKILGKGLLRLESTSAPPRTPSTMRSRNGRATDNIRRLWSHDKTLWTNADEDRWQGWLDITRARRGGYDPTRLAGPPGQKRRHRACRVTRHGRVEPWRPGSRRHIRTYCRLAAFACPRFRRIRNKFSRSSARSNPPKPCSL